LLTFPATSEESGQFGLLDGSQLPLLDFTSFSYWKWKDKTLKNLRARFLGLSPGMRIGRTELLEYETINKKKKHRSQDGLKTDRLFFFFRLRRRN